MAKLVIIDGNAILHRAFHAIPPLTTKNGEPINAVYGLVSMFLRVVQDLKPDAIVVAFDEKEPTFRHKALKTYQAQRPPMADELSSQFDKAKEFLKAAGIPIYSKPGFEADDIIGTIAKQATETSESKDSVSNEIVIITGDRDILQLVNDRKGIKLFMPMVGLSNGKIFGEKETVERMKVSPEQIPDYKALVGDPSDNYPGVVGIGPVIAVKLLEKYKNLDNIYTHLSEIEPNIRHKLESQKSDVEIYHKLATIVQDVPIKIDFPQMKRWKLDSPEVVDLFKKFGFKTLLERIKKVGKEVDVKKQGLLF